MGHRRRLANPAAETVGERSPDRNIAFPLDTLPCLLAARPPGWFWRAGNRHCGALHQLERTSADKPRDPATGRLFLGVLHLFTRRHGVPHYWAASARSYQRHRRLSAFATGNLRCGHRRRGDRGAVCLGLPRWLFPQSEERTLRRRGSGPLPWHLPVSAASSRLRQPSPFRLQFPLDSHFLIAT